jgi:ABC-2 type transport system permease protein
MFGRIFELLRKEFILLFRDPATRGIIFGVPVIQLILFGYVVSTDVKNIQFAVLDQDRTAESRTLVERFVASPYFFFHSQVNSEKEMEELLLGQYQPTILRRILIGIIKK